MAQPLTPKRTSHVITNNTREDNTQQAKNYPKNSMDRFGDELSQVLLSYLSFDDRFRYECVSKRFRKTVFKSVVDIDINDRFINLLTFNVKTIDTKILATIAIKCANIETIDCRGIRNRYGSVSTVLHTFRHKCLHLRQIYCNLWRNSDQWIRSLGPLVTRIGDIYGCVECLSLNHCHRLSQLRAYSLDQVFDISSGKLMAKNLQKFELNFYSNNSDEHRLSAFVAQNRCLKSVAFVTNRSISPEILTEVSEQLSRLTQLRELRLKWWTSGDQISFGDILMTIGVNCKQLKRLSIDFCSRSKEFNLKTLDSLRYYRRLKRLHLTLYVTVDEISLDPLRHCRRLTHLDIDFVEMNAKVFAMIRKNCPQLQCLCVHNVKSFITATSLDLISRLPALQMLVIEYKFKRWTDLRDNVFPKLLSRSTQLKNIEIIVVLIAGDRQGLNGPQFGHVLKHIGALRFIGQSIDKHLDVFDVNLFIEYVGEIEGWKFWHTLHCKDWLENPMHTLQVIAEENPIDYGEQANTDAVQLRVYNLVLPIGTIMDAAEKRYKKQGLTVPIKLYDDVKEFAMGTIPWIFEQFKAVTNESVRERVTAQFVGEVHGFNYLSKRLDKIRLSTPLNITGSSENLLGRIKALEGFMHFSLDDEIQNASHPVWTAFHARAIDKIPFEEAKQANLQVLIQDLSHAVIPPL
ncbi:unnamed protein product, partial [Medioppia subpectinata]